MRPRILIAAIMTFVAVSAWAAPTVPPAPATDTPARQMSHLSTEITILKKELEVAKLRTEIAAGGAPSSSLPAPGAALPLPPGGQGALPPAPSAQIKVWSIARREGRFVATLSVDGQAVDVRQGDAVNGGWRVATITTRTVILKRGGSVKTLRI
ncbi:MAG: type IV pilus biogenesis protein PilP [Betaproteobacteria bacterium]|nr:type IV pilus biogenesis protein PilP [Betaproteobacteria bacterium]